MRIQGVSSVQWKFIFNLILANQMLTLLIIFQMKADRREDKITSGPISEVLSGIQYGDGRRKQVMSPPYNPNIRPAYILDNILLCVSLSWLQLCLLAIKMKVLAKYCRLELYRPLCLSETCFPSAKTSLNVAHMLCILYFFVY